MNLDVDNIRRIEEWLESAVKHTKPPMTRKLPECHADVIKNGHTAHSHGPQNHVEGKLTPKNYIL